MTEMIQKIELRNIPQVYDLAPVKESLQEYFKLQAEDDQSNRNVTISFFTKAKKQRLTVQFDQPIELKRAWLPIDLAVSRAVDADNVGDPNLLKRRKISSLAVRAPEVMPG